MCVRIRAVVIEDEALIAQYLAELLDDTCQVEAVGSATESKAGLRLCAELRPDAVFVDINLPGKDGVLLVTQLTMLPQPPRLVSTCSARSPPLRIWSCEWGTSLEDDYGYSDKKESVFPKIAFVGAWAFWKAPRFRGSPSVMLRENMETLIFALIASYNAHRQQEWVVAEPEEFQPFDLQALRDSADNKPSQSSSRREAYVPQTA